MKKLYVAFGLLVLAVYGVVMWLGLDFHQTKRGKMPQSARSRQGGYRSYWHTGYYGGK